MLIRKILHIISIVVLFCGFTSHNSNSQNQQLLDSLNIELDNAKHDTVRVFLYLDIAYAFEYSIPDSASFYNNKALDLVDALLEEATREGYDDVEKNKLLTLKAKLLNLLGNVQKGLGNYLQASENFRLSLDIYQELKDSIGISKSYNNIGVIYARQSDYVTAKEYFSKSLEIYSRLNDKIGMSEMYNNLGLVNVGIGNYDEALVFYEKSLEIDN